MKEIADRYRRLADRFTHVVESVSGEEWGNPSPCEEWSARDVLEHVVESEWGFLERFGFAPAGAEPSWPLVRDTMQALLDDPQRAGTEYQSFFGPTTVAETVDGFFSFDLLVHAWDIARATGLTKHEEMEEAEVDRYLEMLRARGDAVRGPGAFGPPLEVDETADLKTRFLAFTGRRN